MLEVRIISVPDVFTKNMPTSQTNKNSVHMKSCSVQMSQTICRILHHFPVALFTVSLFRHMKGCAVQIREPFTLKRNVFKTKLSTDLCPVSFTLYYKRIPVLQLHALKVILIRRKLHSFSCFFNVWVRNLKIVNATLT